MLRLSRIWPFVRSTLIILVAFFLLRWIIYTFVGCPYHIPTTSMENTIMAGDRVLGERVSYYFADPQPGDIVVFEDPEMPGRLLVKRVIAVGGQTVSFVGGAVLVDGKPQNAPYAKGKSYPATDSATSANVHYPYTVPEGELWVMGDNRENSQDSRYFGSIPVDSVLGKIFFTYWPLDRISPLR